MYDLSILIPARNEEFLTRTVEDILLHIEGKTELIVVLDGAQSKIKLPKNARLSVISNSRSIGQRAATNKAARQSTAKYLMKVDAHCAFDQGFDVKLMSVMQDDWTMVPVMRNLHAFNWVCSTGHKRYQGPSGSCLICGKETTKEVVWVAKANPESTSYSFDSEFRLQYFNENKKKQKGELVESMSLQGSCFMLTREKYWALNICDEKFGSWGQQGVEVSCKSWLSGGKVVVNKKTWYAHMFRTQGGDFSFPYPLLEQEVDRAALYSKKLFLKGGWPQAKYPLTWLVSRFNPPGWSSDIRHGRTLVPQDTANQPPSCYQLPSPTPENS